MLILRHIHARLNQPHWARTKDTLLVVHADVYTEYNVFLSFMAEQVQQRLSSNSEGLALNWIRKNIGGVGVYTSAEE